MYILYIYSKPCSSSLSLLAIATLRTPLLFLSSTSKPGRHQRQQHRTNIRNHLLPELPELPVVQCFPLNSLLCHPHIATTEKLLTTLLVVSSQTISNQFKQSSGQSCYPVIHVPQMDLKSWRFFGGRAAKGTDWGLQVFHMWRIRDVRHGSCFHLRLQLNWSCATGAAEWQV